jgi:type II secretory pathway pseudopilin PulG
MRAHSLRLLTGCELGMTLIELLFGLAVMSTVGAVAIPVVRDALDDLRASTAARHLGARTMSARIEAVKRSTCVALRFEPAGIDYRYASFRDGNANGVRTADIRAGIDAPLTAFEAIRDKFQGVQFGLMANVPDVDGNEGTGSDGVRIGAAGILTMSPDGTSSSGTLYLHGRKGQYAVRVLGITGRVRVLQYLHGSRQWITR